MTQPTSSDDEDPIYGPVIPAELLRRRREDQERAERENDDRGLAEVLAQLKAKAEAELAAWAALPCGGQLERVTACSDEFASTCERKRDPYCPRAQLREAKRKAEQERIERRAEAKARGVPDLVLANVYDTTALETTALRQLREAFAAMPAPCLVVMAGPPGVGKTTAAGAWCVERGGRFITVAGLSRVDRYSDESWNRVAKARALVLDELGQEFLDGKGFMTGVIDTLVNDRYSDRLPTVITTNLSAEEFKARYDERVSRRIREEGRFLWIGGASVGKRAS